MSDSSEQKRRKMSDGPGDTGEEAEKACLVRVFSRLCHAERRKMSDTPQNERRKMSDTSEWPRDWGVNQWRRGRFKEFSDAGLSEWTRHATPRRTKKFNSAQDVR